MNKVLQSDKHLYSKKAMKMMTAIKHKKIGVDQESEERVYGI